MKKAEYADYKYFQKLNDNCSNASRNINRKHDHNQFDEKLRRAGRKSTRLGSELYKFLLKTRKPVTAGTIYRSLQIKVNLSSIYRALKKFLQLGLIFEEKIENESYYYISEKHHHHIICIKCGSIRCVPCRLDFSQIGDFTGVTHELTLKGLCSDCLKK